MRQILNATFCEVCVFERINHARVIAAGEHRGHEAFPSPAIIDGQSVNTGESGPRSKEAGPVPQATRQLCPFIDLLVRRLGCSK